MSAFGQEVSLRVRVIELAETTRSWGTAEAAQKSVGIILTDALNRAIIFHLEMTRLAEDLPAGPERSLAVTISRHARETLVPSTDELLDVSRRREEQFKTLANGGTVDLSDRNRVRDEWNAAANWRGKYVTLRNEAARQFVDAAE